MDLGLSVRRWKGLLAFMLLVSAGGLLNLRHIGADEATNSVAPAAAEAELLGQLTEDRTQDVSVHVPAVLRVAGERLYSANLQVKNSSGQALRGPLRLVIDAIEPAGLEVGEPNGAPGEAPSFLILRADQELPAGESTGLLKVIFRAEDRLAADARRALKLSCRVLGQPAEPDDVPAAREPADEPEEPAVATDRSLPAKAPEPADEEPMLSDFDDDAEMPEDAPEDLAPNAPPEAPREEYERVFAIQDRATPELLRKKGVAGTGTGMDREGNLVIHIFTERAGVGDLPQSIEGVPVRTLVTGAILARRDVLTTAGKDNPRTRFHRPVPIGISIGNLNAGITGTLGCRVLDRNGHPCILSNNHVIAADNDAPLRDLLTQPGPLDSRDGFTLQNDQDGIAVLSDFARIKFNGDPNRVDAAIARVIGTFVGNGTPPNGGYGIPRSRHRGVRINLRVQKYGRTTGLTRGTILARNVTTPVSFGPGKFALFIDQILVVGDSAGFLNSGDSGSLLVDNNRRPVGLLFAGSLGGRFAFANRMSAVLNRLQITIDGED